ncbi:hypothetical protein ABZ588_30900 [Streptomyces althioticus]|uniref:hypothetical protein n=1 Tax=Streptomyces althioticus TaxID=83380 RepID=UPI0033F7A11A
MSFLADAVDAIHEHAAEVYALLDDAGRAELLEILADADDDPLAAADEIRDLVKTLLPPQHPLRAALVPPGVRYLATAEDGTAVRSSLDRLLRQVEDRGLVTRTGPDAAGAAETSGAHTARQDARNEPPTLHDNPAAPPALRDSESPETPLQLRDSESPELPLQLHDGPPERPLPTARPEAPGRPDADEQPVPPYRPDAHDAWLLAAPAVPAASLGLTPEEPRDLILLTDEREVERVPVFQFDPRTQKPYPVVVEINRLLSAEEDPWGASDWWLGSNVWLDAAPVELLGTGADQALLSAARAEFPEW